jgi:hypothetical protein
VDIKRGLKRKEGKGNNEGRMVWGEYFFRVRFWIFANFEGIERIFGARYEWGSIKNQNMKVNK